MIFIILFIVIILFIGTILFGDWGLGIGDWAQSPIPNPQSPILFNNLINKLLTTIKPIFNIIIQSIYHNITYKK